MASMEVDDKYLKKINRQLRTIKFVLMFFFILILVALALLGYMTYKVVHFTNQVNTKITNIEQTTQQKLDLKAQLCDEPSQNYVTKQICR